MFKKLFTFVSPVGKDDEEEDIIGFQKAIEKKKVLEEEKKFTKEINENKITERKKSMEMDIEKLFLRYNKITRKKNKRATKEEVREAGLLQFAKDCGIEPEDAFFLVLFEKFKCKEQYMLSKEEFVNGFKGLCLSNLEEIRNQVPSIQKELKDVARFKEVYDFAFKYHSVSNSIEVELAILVWKCLFSSSYIKYKGIDNFFQFCKVYFTIKDISKELWMESLNIVIALSTLEKDSKDGFEKLLKNGKIEKTKFFNSYVDYMKDNKLF